MKAKQGKISGMDSVVNLLIAKGWIACGQTHRESFSIVTKQSYPLPGAVISRGGRLRFELPNTSQRVTVGKRIVCFYEVVGGNAVNFKNFKVSEFASGIVEAF